MPHSAVPVRNSAVRAIVHTPNLQPKLRVGAVNDPAEAEADRVADQIMRMPQPAGIAADPPPLNAASNGVIRRKAVFEDSGSCNIYQKCKIISAWDLAMVIVDDTVAAVKDVVKNGSKSSSYAAINARFPTATAPQLTSLLANLVAIRGELNSDIKSDCPEKQEKSDSGFVLAATTCAVKADIDFYSPFLVTDCRTQAQAIIHEIAHHIVCLIKPAIEVTRTITGDDGEKKEVRERTGDVYHQFPEFASLTAAQALQNPDSYAVLSTTVSNKADCFDCSFEMQAGTDEWKERVKRINSEHRFVKEEAQG